MQFLTRLAALSISKEFRLLAISWDAPQIRHIIKKLPASIKATEEGTGNIILIQKLGINLNSCSKHKKRNKYEVGDKQTYLLI